MESVLGIRRCNVWTDFVWRGEGSDVKQPDIKQAISNQNNPMEAISKQNNHLEAISNQNNHFEAISNQNNRMEAISNQNNAMDAISKQNNPLEAISKQTIFKDCNPNQTPLKEGTSKKTIQNGYVDNQAIRKETIHMTEQQLQQSTQRKAVSHHPIRGRSITLSYFWLPPKLAAAPAAPAAAPRQSSSPYRHWSGFIILILLTMTTLLPGALGACDETHSCYPDTVDLIDTSKTARQFTVTSTCGEGGITTVYTKSADTLDETRYYCNSSVGFSHPKELMIDQNKDTIIGGITFDNPKLQTYWQSALTVANVGDNPTEQIVALNLTDQFLVRSIDTVFLSPHITDQQSTTDMRPLAMVIEYQRTTGDPWRAWRYYADNCATRFPGIPGYSASTIYNDVVCQQKYYGGDSSANTQIGFGRQVTTFNPALLFSNLFDVDPQVYGHFVVSGVRQRITVPRDPTNPLSSYVAIADLVVQGQCSCFGHADTCVGPNANQCVCKHFTMGVNCEQCQDSYNNKPWRMGHSNKANACEECGCNGHAVKCVYDAAKDTGVCQDCTVDTTGDKCQFCKANFYVNPQIRDPNVTLWAPGDTCQGFNGLATIDYDCDRWCIPCNCSTDGTVQNNYECQNYTGQCTCKLYVMNRECNECMDEYWNLDANNPLGCTACSCSSAGTLENRNLCDKATGECLCKNNTMGRDCNSCKPNTYALSDSNPEGCLPCTCDPGGATSPSCNVNSGECTCRPLISGRMCTQPDAGNFGPLLDQLRAEAEFQGQAEPQGALPVVERTGHGEPGATVSGTGFVQLAAGAVFSFNIRVRTTAPYNAVLRYESAGTWPAASTELSLTDTEIPVTNQFQCGGETVTVGAKQTTPKALPVAVSTGGLIMGEMCLQGDTQYKVDLTLGAPTPAGQTLLLDSLVMLPVITSFSSYINAADQAAVDACYQAALTPAPSTDECQRIEYSLMTELNNGATACACDSTGSTNSFLCSGLGGQCPCKANVMLQDCSMCKVDHYGFQSGAGCTPCECNVQGSVKTACDETGTCECKANVTTTKCSTCIAEHWGLFTGNGCVPCTCNMVYSLDNACQDSGQCNCKYGIGGQQCTECADGYFDLTPDNCTDCGCDRDGSSVGSMCNKLTGECSCKANVEGSKCDTCKKDFFGLGPWGTDGCIPCFCSGFSKNCTSAPGWYLASYNNSWDLTQDLTAIQPLWTAETLAGVACVVEQKIEIENSQSQFVMRLDDDAGDCFLKSSDVFKGQKQGAYGQRFGVEMTYNVPTPPAGITYTDSTTTVGDVILKGLHTSFVLVASFTTIPGTSRTSNELLLHESKWKKDTLAGAAPTYEEFLQVISDLDAILVRSSYKKATNATDGSVSDVDGGYTDLYSAFLQYTTQDIADGDPANNIEQCVCPPEYTGQFCESCAPGYKRTVANGGAFAACVPCECNNHGTGAIPCEPESGKCNCTDNTQGDKCELCADGWFGVATAGTPVDCSPCMCPGDVVAGAVNVFAATCQLDTLTKLHKCTDCADGHGGDRCEVCVDGWYGTPEDPANANGVCKRCVCNGRASTCNTTSGICTACTENTAGKECDICAATYYGNPMLAPCQACDCTAVGATGQCNDVTGQCVCKPNVQGFACDACMLNSYNYTSGEGCYACSCNAIGSTGASCHLETGQCTCHPLVTGRQCDRCQDAYWNLNPTTHCDACECKAEGTMQVAGLVVGTCDLVTGQCECKLPGIIGRTCDKCAPGSIGTYPACELCGECYDSWARKADDIGIAMKTQHDIADEIWNHYGRRTSESVGPTLEDMQADLTNVQSSIENAQQLVDKLNYLDTGFQGVSADVANYTAVLNEIENHMSTVQTGLNAIIAYSGAIQVSPAPVLPAALHASTLEVAALHATLAAAATASWEAISRMSGTIADADGSVTALTARVTAALASLADAVTTREQADAIIAGEFASGYATNSATLDEVRAGWITLQGLVITLQNTVIGVQSVVQQAADTVTQSRAVVLAKQTEMALIKVNSQVTMFNATTTLTVVKDAQTEAVKYKDLATNAKQRITVALEKVVRALDNRTAIDATVAEYVATIQNIMNINLRPLNNLQIITALIKTTQISDANVAATEAQAQTALATAREVDAITKQAGEEAGMTQEAVNSIKSYLQETTNTVTDVNSILASSAAVNTSAHSAIAQANLRTTQVDLMAVDTQQAETVASGQISAALVTTAEHETTLVSLVSQAQAANALTEEAATIQASNHEKVDSLTAEVESDTSGLASTLAQLQQLTTSINNLETELQQIKDITDLTALLANYISMKQEQLTMENSLAVMDAELSQLLGELATLTDSSKCKLNT